MSQSGPIHVVPPLRQAYSLKIFDIKVRGALKGKAMTTMAILLRSSPDPWPQYNTATRTTLFVVVSLYFRRPGSILFTSI